MELLFNTDNASASELHEILGFIDSDFSLIQVLPYLRKSTKEIIHWIGEQNYVKVLDWYENDESNDFLTMVRYTIVLGAFREFAPLLDVSYTTSGRVFRSDDHTKAAFEWMIDKSNEAMERSYYASLNDIIVMTIEDRDLFPTPFINDVKGMFVSTLKTFQEFVNIDDSHLLFLKLIPSLKLAEHRLIYSRCRDKMDEYLNTDSHIKKLIQQCCVYFAMIDGLKKNSVQLFPQGVVQVEYQQRKNKTANRLDVEATVLYYKEELSKLLQDLEIEIAKSNQKISTKRDVNFEPEDGFVTM
ncbi:MAG: hypothetical protein CSA38_01970 [Flavobacteriales bacterium]|nr:MAG: hypothetical protein CSA38_01970 [Flavobacteriales bacterium]